MSAVAPVQLGLGLIGIGRPWGYVPGEPPPERDALDLLAYALELGVRVFDTAPSYGSSEERLAKFLRSLTADERRELVVATKFGEHWDRAKAAPFVDHSFDALRRSLDRSLARLGPFEILQLHMTRPEVLRSDDLARAWEYALSLGVLMIGPSVSDPESARIAIAEPRYSCLQIPLSLERPDFAEWAGAAGDRGMWVAVNGPLARGKLASSLKDAFEFVLRHSFRGAILTGTRTKAHLRQNWDAFHAALAAR
jgi:aryl-alcohol dehydrogenase-like predicted oxidoreductase